MNNICFACREAFKPDQNLKTFDDKGYTVAIHEKCITRWENIQNGYIFVCPKCEGLGVFKLDTGKTKKVRCTEEEARERSGYNGSRTIEYFDKEEPIYLIQDPCPLCNGKGLLKTAPKKVIKEVIEWEV